MKYPLGAALIALAAAAAAPFPALAATTITGPTLSQFSSGWNVTGLQFTAKRNATLTGFTFQNRGLADEVLLLAGPGSAAQFVATAPGFPALAVSVNWKLVKGVTYDLVQRTKNNGTVANFGAALPSNADIAITRSGFFSRSFYSYPQSPNAYWANFSAITTSGAVPEPITWALLVCGFGAIGSQMRSARRACPQPNIA